ncbi:MAG: Chromosome (plasmid) partitioning protein ParB / Stage 0 sporulation protein [Rickettsiaceae bacterium]|jgi:ParB family chromosome partitioning protein|nr:Chromosome (plasmid) partitioning protein ParB / Stage 0 sporulation protein [Rickettsiaceae bacterium]
MEINNDRKLGRGLSALLGDSPKTKESKIDSLLNGEESVQSLAMQNIIAGVYQPRKAFDDQKLTELSNSIRENGVVQPIIVRATDKNGVFEIVAGERRFRAAKMAGLVKIPAIVKDINNTQALEFAIIENVQRADLSPIEEANGYKQLMNEFEYTQDQVAKKIGRSRSHVANILRLLFLPVEVQQMLDLGKITFGHAKAIMNSEDVVDIARQIVANNWTVRDVEAFLRNSGSLAEEQGDGEEQTDKVKKPTPSSPKNKKVKNQKVRDIESQIAALFPNTVVRAEFDQQRQQGRITISFKDLAEIEELVNNL